LVKWGGGRSLHLAGRRPGLGKNSPHPQAAVRSQSSVLRRQRRDGKRVRGRRGAEPPHVARPPPRPRGARRPRPRARGRERGGRPRSHSPAAGPAGGRRARTTPAPRAGHGTEDDSVAHVLDEAAVLLVPRVAPDCHPARTRRPVRWCSPPYDFLNLYGILNNRFSTKNG
jgi:hypothetical protein